MQKNLLWLPSASGGHPKAPLAPSFTESPVQLEPSGDSIQKDYSMQFTDQTKKHQHTPQVYGDRFQCEVCKELATHTWQDNTIVKKLCSHCFNVRTQEAMMSQSVVENCL